MKNCVKKLFAGLSSACMIAASVPVAFSAANAAEKEITYGDANCDGEVNLADAVLIMQSIANPDKYSLTADGANNADVANRGDGITNSDALTIQRYKLNLVDKLPVSYKENSDVTTGTTTGTATTTTSATTTSASTTSSTTTTGTGTTSVSTTGTVTTSGTTDPAADICYIHLKGDKITVEGAHATASGSKVVIDHSGTFMIDGTLTDGQIEVNIADEAADPETVKLFLNGVNITGKSAPAILVTNAENTSINLVDGTENTITDGDTAYAEGGAVIEAKDDLTIKGGEKGDGILNLTANTQDGISCNNDIKINGGVINITTLNSTDKTDAVKGKTSVTIKDGKITVDAEGDGIKSSKGSVTVAGGFTSIKAGNDAVQAGTTIDVTDGILIAGGDRGLTAVEAINLVNGNVYATATDNQVDTKLLAGTTKTTVLLNCIDDATNEKDGTWKKANTISASGKTEYAFTKKYKYVLISDAYINGAKSCSFTNLGTGAQVTHTDGTQTQFQLSTVTVFENVDPAGSNITPPVPAGDPTSDGYTITLSGATAQSNAPEDTVSVSNGTVTIKKEGTFAVSGKSSGVQIMVDVDKTAYPDAVVELDLSGAEMSNDTTAPIFVNSVGGEVVITAKKDTENIISDGSSHTQTYKDSDGNDNTVEGAIFARDDIKFKGTGSLTVNGNQDDAIVCKNDIKIYNGNIKVNAVDDGIRGKDSVTIGNASKSDGSEVDYSNLNLTVKTTQGDGIKSTATDTATDKSYGVVTINGGTVSIDSHADGIQAEQEFIMNGGDLIIKTYEGSSYSGSGAAAGGNQGGWGGPGGGFPGGFGGDGNSSKTDISAKGIKAVGLYDAAGTTWQSKGNITINGGNITIDSSDDCIHCGGDMDLIGGALKLASADDGCHSDHNLTIGKGSATTYDDITISITKAYEGIEGLNIVQNSGTVIVTSTDDGFNAAGGNDGSGNQPGGGGRNPWGQGGFGQTTNSNICMTFNGGFALVNVSNGDHDGYDSNGNIKLNGGIQVSNGNEPFDCGDGGYSVSANGSTWVSYYGSVMGDSLASSASVSTSGSAAAGTRISLVGSDGKVIVSFIRGQKDISTFKAGGANTSGASFCTGGTVSGGTELIAGDSNGVFVGGTLSGGTKISK